jgi:pentatricopeptide repeat protein
MSLRWTSSGSSVPPPTKRPLLKGTTRASWYLLSSEAAAALVDGDLCTPRPSLKPPTPWGAKTRANAATLEGFLRKHASASPQDLHRIHRSRGFVASIARCGANWQAALATLQRMQAEPEGADVYATAAAISACAKAGRWQEAVALLESMESQGLEANAVVMTAAITACGRAKQWEKALSLFHTMESRGLPLPTASFNAAISAAG